MCEQDDMVFLVVNGVLKRTENWYDDKPEWKIISPNGPWFTKFALHPRQKNVGLLQEKNGMWICEDLHTETPGWRKDD